MKINMAHLHRCCRSQHNCRSYSRRLRSTLTYLNLRLLEHLAYIEITTCKTREVSLGRIKYRRCTQLADDAIERQILLDSKLRQLQVDQTFFHIVTKIHNLLCIQALHHIINALALVRKKHHHSISTITIRKIDSLEGVILGIVELLNLVHHLHFLYITCITTEVLFLRVSGIKLRLPCTIKEDGIHQI